MAEDWRVTASLGDGDVDRVVDALREHRVEEVRGRIAVSAGEHEVFLYADTAATAQEAESVLRNVLDAAGITADIRLDRWHPIEEAWEDASVPLPQSDEQRHAEHERLEAEDARESAETGVAQWEVRVELESHGDAVELAERLEGEGESVVRRWTFLLVGAATEDDATTLARRIGQEAQAGATVHVEPGGGAAWAIGGSTPFAVFGGLGG